MGRRSASLEYLRARYQLPRLDNALYATPADNPPNVLNSCPDWALELAQPTPYKALYGGRGGGKSHAFATLLLQRLIDDPDLQAVCIREIQVSLTYSSKLLLEQKIRGLGLENYFEIQRGIIKRRGGRGFIIFRGMQDHTADNIKSLEGFMVAWWEEAQTASRYSLDLLLPTIRADGAEVWFSWNPDQPDDPVDDLFRGGDPPGGALIKCVNLADNPLASDTLRRLEREAKERDHDRWEWIWNGGYNTKSDALIFAGGWREGIIDTTKGWDGPYYGADFGFSADPTTAIELWRAGNQIYVSRCSYAYRLENDRIAPRWMADVPAIERHTVRADSALPATISYLQRHGLPRIIGAKKGPGSVESGVQWLRSHQFVVHPDCEDVRTEFRRYRYKQNKAGDVLEGIVDADNHAIDAMRYAFEPLILESSGSKSKRYWDVLTQ